jgi:hypothetical protein
MSRTKIALAGLFLCSTLVMTAAAQKNQETPVTSIIEGFGVNTSPTLRIQSDLLGSYKNSSSVQSILQSYGDWVLDTDYAKPGHTSSSPRKILIDFRDPTPTNGGNPTALFPDGWGVVTARFISKCTQFGEDMRTMLGVNSQITCPLAVGIQVPNFPGSYLIAMNHIIRVGTDSITITCTGVVDPTKPATSPCNQWRFEPWALATEDHSGKSIGKLIGATQLKNGTEVDMGNFYFSFAIDVTKP